MSDFCGEAGLPDFDAPPSSTPAPATSTAGENWTVRVASNGVFVELLTPNGEVAFDKFHDFTSACKVCEAINSHLAALREQLEQAQKRLSEICAGAKADAADLEKMRDGTKLTRSGIVEIIVYQQQDIRELRQQLATRDAALRQKDEALERAMWQHSDKCNGCNVSRQSVEDYGHIKGCYLAEALSIQPDSFALNAVIEAADLPSAATLSAGEQSRKETGEARRVIGGIIIPSAPPIGVIDALRAFVTAVYNYEETGVWPDNGTIRLLAEQGKDALEGIGRNLSPDSPSKHATGVSLPKESAGAPSGQTAGVAPQKAQPQ
jgi:hypothetical protein